MHATGCARPGADEHLEANLDRRARPGRCIPRRRALVTVHRADEITPTIRILISIQQRLRDADPDRRHLAAGDDPE